jgi:DNA repair exonuclease SbcCD ATPase subunit
MSRREKTKAKTRREKDRSSGSKIWEENQATTPEEVIDRTLNMIHSLGRQKFGLPPFSDHFNRWLINLKDVVSEFDSSTTISVDDQFLKESSQILSNIELELEKRRQQEVSCREVIKNLSNNRILLEQIKEEYASKTKEIEGRKESQIKRLSNNIDDLREELTRISQMKTGIFRALSVKAKVQKEAEATQRLNSDEKELESAVQKFSFEQKKLLDEYEKREQPIIEQIQNQEKEIENQEVDSSIEARGIACEALVNIVNALVQRKSSIIH